MNPKDAAPPPLQAAPADGNPVPTDSSQELRDLQDHLKIAQQDLQQMDRLKLLASSAAAIVHDVRNSLGVISSTAQFALSKLDPSEKERQAWELVLRNVESIKKILKGYLGLARQTEEHRERISLNEIANRVAHFIDVQVKKHHIQLALRLDSSLPEIQINVPSVESAVLNLAINSIEAMGTGGHLTLATAVDPETKSVRLEVEDSGPGIPPDMLEKIFLPFHTTKAQGTGMGLYSAKAAVELHGGTVRCLSKPGQTRMILTFPIVPEPAAP